MIVMCYSSHGNPVHDNASRKRTETQEKQNKTHETHGLTKRKIKMKLLVNKSLTKSIPSTLKCGILGLPWWSSG